MQCASPSPRGIFLTPHTSSACLLCVNGATKGFLRLICMSSINKFLAFFQSLLFPAYGPSQVTVHLSQQYQQYAPNKGGDFFSQNVPNNFYSQITKCSDRYYMVNFGHMDFLKSLLQGYRTLNVKCNFLKARAEWRRNIESVHLNLKIGMFDF